MIVKDIEFTLKDGRKAVIRSPRYEDIEGLLNYLHVSAGETEFILRTPEDCGRYTPEGEKDWIDRYNNSKNGVTMVCMVDGKVAGNCDITWSLLKKIRHRARIGIALLKEYWNLGIGTKFFEEMIRIAEEDGQITQIELEFIEGNTRARALYEKMGFRITGLKPNAVRMNDGSLRNEYQMVREIKR